MSVSSAAALTAVLSLGCGDDGAGEGEGEGAPDCSYSTECDDCLAPGKDDQTTLVEAIINAGDGSTVCLSAGTYTFNSQVDIAAANFTLRGAGSDQSILDFSAQDVGGNALAFTGDGAVIEDLQIHNAQGDGVRATDVVGFTARRVSALWDTSKTENPGYGIYPVGSQNVLVEDSEVSGVSDTGIYVGQSSGILVRNNEVWGNVAGIEIENSTEAEIVNNDVHDNSSGILVFNLPELPVQGGARAKVHENVIENNNLANFAAEGNIVALVPTGTGMLILASDDNEIHDNEIRNNETTGIIIVSYLEGLFPSYEDENYDIYPQGNYVHDNTFESNGLAPHDLFADLFPDLVPAPDLIWDGCIDVKIDNSDGSETNCFDQNGDADYRDLGFCDATPSTDIGEVTCQHAQLPEQMF